jgi:hypothetical protein
MSQAGMHHVPKHHQPCSYSPCSSAFWQNFTTEDHQQLGFRNNVEAAAWSDAQH